MRRGGSTTVAVALAAAWPAIAEPLPLAPCHLAAAEGRIEVDAQCDTLSVPLDWDEAGGGDIELAVAVVPALAEQPLPDPLVVLAGGPGQAATEFYASSHSAFDLVARERDVLLVDQRGTGGSAALACESVDALGPLGPSAPDEAGWVAAWVYAVLACLTELAHDPRFFTTSAAVRDLDAVRQRLGYQRLNLYGISYGTRVAQHYLRRYPQRVRSVVLDGVLPPTLALGPDVAPASQTALDALLERCRQDAACEAAFPRLGGQFQALLARLTAAPVEVTVDHPLTGVATTLALNRHAVAGITRLLVYSPLTASLWPPAVAAAYDGDYVPLATQATAVADAVGDLAVGLNYAVLCTEDAPFWGEVDWAAQAATYMGAAFAAVTEGVCREWPRGVLDDDLKAPLASDKPALLLSGELDPITPPRYGSVVAADLAGALHVVGPGQGHGMVVVPCAARIMADFVAAGSVAGLDVSCVERIRPAPLFVSRLGPGP